MVVAPAADGGGVRDVFQVMEGAEHFVFCHPGQIFKAIPSGVQHEDDGKDDVGGVVASGAVVVDDAVQGLFQFQVVFKFSQQDASTVSCDFFLASFQFFLYSHFCHLFG